MISILNSLKHCAWADDRFLKDLMDLPDSVLSAEYVPGGWNVAQNVSHWVGSTTWYRYCLGIGPEEGQPDPQTMADVEALRVRLAEFNSSFFAEAEKDEEVLTVRESDGSTFEVRRSSLLLQVVAHAIEHRTQIACALETVGQRLDLMRYSMWGWPE